jgi:hypothetical protein
MNLSSFMVYWRVTGIFKINIRGFRKIVIYILHQFNLINGMLTGCFEV